MSPPDRRDEEGTGDPDVVVPLNPAVIRPATRARSAGAGRSTSKRAPSPQARATEDSDGGGGGKAPIRRPTDLGDSPSPSRGGQHIQNGSGTVRSPVSRQPTSMPNDASPVRDKSSTGLGRLARAEPISEPISEFKSSAATPTTVGPEGPPAEQHITQELPAIVREPSPSVKAPPRTVVPEPARSVTRPEAEAPPAAEPATNAGSPESRAAETAVRGPMGGAALADDDGLEAPPVTVARNASHRPDPQSEPSRSSGFFAGLRSRIKPAVAPATAGAGVDVGDDHAGVSSSVQPEQEPAHAAPAPSGEGDLRVPDVHSVPADLGPPGDDPAVSDSVSDRVSDSGPESMTDVVRPLARATAAPAATTMRRQPGDTPRPTRRLPSTPPPSFDPTAFDPSAFDHVRGRSRELPRYVEAGPSSPFDAPIDDLDHEPRSAEPSLKRPVRTTASTGRRRPRVRRVTRVVRHVDPWSVFKVAVCFSTVLYGVCLTAAVMLWNVAYTTGTVDNVERFFESFGWDTFEFNGGELYHNAWIAGLFGVIGLTGLIVLSATLFNLITDLVGGVRVTVLEEELVERDPVQRRSTLRGRRPASGVVVDPYDPDAPLDVLDPFEVPVGTASMMVEPVRVQPARSTLR